MYKELIISTVIIIIIVLLDFSTQNYTKKTVNETNKGLDNLKQMIEETKSHKEISDEACKIYDRWLTYHEKLAFYIEHDELEKVETNFIMCKSLIDSERYDLALSELEKTKYVLEHISDKYSINLVNIF